MRLLLLAGTSHGLMSVHAAAPWTLVNHQELRVRETPEFIHNLTAPGPEAVLITDEALPDGLAAERRVIQAVLELCARMDTGVPVVLVTRDPLHTEVSSALRRQYSGFSVLAYDMPRLPLPLIEEAFARLKEGGRSAQRHPQASGGPDTGQVSEPAGKKRSFLDRFRSKPRGGEAPAATDPLSRELANISRGMSRVVAVTGHRGSGLTSTAVNLAAEAAKRGLNTILVDLDTDYRGSNLYFSGFDEQARRDEHLGSSLIRMLARPQDYRQSAFHVKGNLWMSTLSYGFQDKRAIGQFLTSEKLAGMLSALRSSFNLVVLDLPLDVMRTLESSLIHMDTFGLCVPNNLYSVLSTLRNIELVLERDSASYLNAKTKVIVTRYNHSLRFRSDLFAPEKVSELLGSGLSDSFRFEPPLAGYVPYHQDFDLQIESDIPLVNSGAEFESAFGKILLRLMEGSG
ncbi:hypothetical protein GCM10010912_58060 [Paenibacillus albidus]|uniref:AAA domain-containing protein n=1 Tax=Paenibacillus albidus TaxID=2041023 RepID=A0A917D0J4_9BACL|nr:AAA family ATPase [Paenibacillus albidus]GGG05787.1 hypothetical protein GCM10010912_58060 [Paenibacillus albidus]